VSAILIRNVRLVDPAAGIDGRRDLLVLGGQVAAVADCISPEDAVGRLRGERPAGPLSVVDGQGLWLWPGLVDGHVHFREPGFTEKETIVTGSLAAAAGGYTSVICEPNTEPAIDSVSIVRELAERARADAVVNVYFKAAMTVGRRGVTPTDVAALAREERVVALSDDGDPLVGPVVMRQVCAEAARAAILLTPHCEDSPGSLKKMNAGLDPGFKPGPAYANEPNFIARDAALAAEAGCSIHFSHVSMGRSVDVIERFRRSATGRRTVTYEVTPHHLLLCAEEFAPGAVPAVNPPLRSAADREALSRALPAGKADAIASDHAPHTAADKAAGASGLIGLETTLGLVLTHLLGGAGLTAQDAVRLMSLSPARIFGLPGGTLKPGSPADMVLIDPAREWTVRADLFRSKSRNTPFEGWELQGKAVATYVGGREVYVEPALEERKTERGAHRQ